MAATGAGRRRRVAASVVRTTLTAVVLLVVYYRAPLDRPADLRVVVWLAVGLTVLAHGITARPLSARFGRRVRDHDRRPTTEQR